MKGQPGPPRPDRRPKAASLFAIAVRWQVEHRGSPREIQRVSKLDPETGALLALDLIVVNTALEQVWATRTTLQAGERRMTVVSREGLATMKRIAGRLQDLVDLTKLEGTADDDPE